MLTFLVFSFLFLMIKNFSKRLIPLLSLEGIMLIIILGVFSLGSDLAFSSFFSYGMVLLVLMVIDSVLGICVLISSCRGSTSWGMSF